MTESQGCFGCDGPQWLLEFLKGNQGSQQFHRKLAWKAFQHVASYVSAVSEWL